MPKTLWVEDRKFLRASTEKVLVKADMMLTSLSQKNAKALESMERWDFSRSPMSYWEAGRIRW